MYSDIAFLHLPRVIANQYLPLDKYFSLMHEVIDVNSDHQLEAESPHNFMCCFISLPLVSNGNMITRQSNCVAF